MPKTIEAIYEDGVFKPLLKIKLPEHIRFKLTISPLEGEEEEVEKTVERQRHALLQIAGIASSGSSDVSKRHNEYL